MNWYQLSEEYSAIDINIKTVEGLKGIQRDLHDSIPNAYKEACLEETKASEKFNK